MFKPIFLLSFCLECTLEVLPMVAIAWLLGCLFWWAYSSSAIKKTKEQLNTQLKTWQKKAQTVEEKLSTVNFDWESANTELNSLRNNYKDLEIKYKALEEFKGTSANMIYEPVPPPHSLVKTMEEEDKVEKRVVYFSPEKNKVEKSENIVAKKIIKAKKSTIRDSNYNKAFSSSDLTIVEGIGPKLEKLLKTNGISTWTRLAVTSVMDIRAVLEKAGSKYIVHDPSSWPQQASLARVGQWDDLILLQKGLSPANKSKVKKLYKKIKGAEAYRIDDLKIIEGIGPKIEQLLKDGGIDNWSKLAAATEADIKQILKAAGDRYRLANPGTWARQADLANRGKLEELKSYQNRLKGGNEM